MSVFVCESDWQSVSTQGLSGSSASGCGFLGPALFWLQFNFHLIFYKSKIFFFNPYAPNNFVNIFFLKVSLATFVASNKPTLTMYFGCQSTLKFFIIREKMSCALSDVHKSKLEVVELLHFTNIGRTYFYSIFATKLGQCLLGVFFSKIITTWGQMQGQSLHPNNFHNYALIRDFWLSKGLSLVKNNLFWT